MHCADFNRLVEFLEGTLEASAKDEVQAHLLGCSACRLLLARVDEVTGSPRGSGDADPPRLPVAIGETLGRYVVRGWLGAGGMGIVARAHDPDLDREIALKLVTLEGGSDAERGRLLREARHAARISHPNVVSVFDVGTAGTSGSSGARMFIAMELVEGESLARWLVSAPRRDEELLAVFLAAAEGLAAAHAAGIIHGDFKPANVVVTASGDAKVTDFGLSLAVEIGTGAAQPGASSARALAGTPTYMAPERWTGRPASAASDQFSFAVALYDALAVDGRARPTPRARKLRARLAPIVARAMSPYPTARHPSVRSLIEALRDAARGRTWRVPAGALGAIALGVVAVSLFVSRLGRLDSFGRLDPLHLLRGATAAPPSPSLAVDEAAAHDEQSEAAQAYRAAQVAYHDALTDAGLRLLTRSLALDPTLAAAHLRYALWADASIKDRREHVELAAQLRANLSERDRVLLDAATSAVRIAAGSYADYARKLAEAAARFPDDAEIAVLQAMAEAKVRLPAAGSDFMGKALALDPRSAQARLGEGEIALWQGDLAAATAAADRCLALSPSGTSCMRLQADIDSLRGDCLAMKRHALAMTAADPRDGRAYALLAMALAATGAPTEAVRETLTTEETLLGPDAGPVPRLHDEAELATLRGELDLAESKLLETAAVPDEDYLGLAHEASFELLLLYEETGQPAKALPVADAYLKRFAAWPHGVWGRTRPLALSTLRAHGLIAEKDFAEQRDVSIQEERDKNLPIEANLAWVDFYARAVRTPPEAKEALLTLPGSLPLPRPTGLRWNDDPVYLLHQEGIGRTFLLGGHPQEAIAPLRLVARSCMGLAEPWAFVEAQLELGQALEATHDVEGACAAYGDVSIHWGAARPRSMSAELAQRRADALRCPLRR